jgi:hypothetical protein
MLVNSAPPRRKAKPLALRSVALTVFWPATFQVGGDGPMAAELAQLKGQMVAIEQASIHKKCGIQFQREPPMQG